VVQALGGSRTDCHPPPAGLCGRALGDPVRLRGEVDVVGEVIEEQRVNVAPKVPCGRAMIEPMLEGIISTPAQWARDIIHDIACDPRPGPSPNPLEAKVDEPFSKLVKPTDGTRQARA